MAFQYTISVCRIKNKEKQIEHILHFIGHTVKTWIVLCLIMRWGFTVLWLQQPSVYRLYECLSRFPPPPPVSYLNHNRRRSISTGILYVLTIRWRYCQEVLELSSTASWDMELEVKYFLKIGYSDFRDKVDWGNTESHCTSWGMSEVWWLLGLC